MIIIGDSATGKSNLILRFTDNVFHESFLPTIGVDFKINNVRLDSETNVKLNIWDTAGQERFKTITSTYYKGCHGVVIVFDLTDKKTFDNVSNWYQDAQKYTSDDSVKILVGNKCDLEQEREVSKQEGIDLAQSLNLHYFETSAKNKINVSEMFNSLTK